MLLLLLLGADGVFMHRGWPLTAAARAMIASEWEMLCTRISLVSLPVAALLALVAAPFEDEVLGISAPDECTDGVDASDAAAAAAALDD